VGLDVNLDSHEKTDWRKKDRKSLPRGNILLEICTPDIRISTISAGYQRYNKGISREN